MLKLITTVILLCLSFFCFASDNGFTLSTGDNNLDSSLNELNKIVTLKKTNTLISHLEKEYQIPGINIKNLFDTFNFSAADVFMAVAISDLTGQPLHMITRAYMEHRTKGWAYVLDQLNIQAHSSKFKQLKLDLSLILSRSKQ